MLNGSLLGDEGMYQLARGYLHNNAIVTYRGKAR